LTKEFLITEFRRFSRNDRLDLDSFDDIFFPFPQDELPWNDAKSLVPHDKNSIDLEGWLNLWNYLSYVDYKKTFRYLAYLGFQHKLPFTFKITRYNRLFNRKG